MNKRIKEHNDGKARATMPHRPWVYAYGEGYFLKKDALYRERILKQSGKVYSQLKRRLKNSLRSA